MVAVRAIWLQRQERAFEAASVDDDMDVRVRAVHVDGRDVVEGGAVPIEELGADSLGHAAHGLRPRAHWERHEQVRGVPELEVAASGPVLRQKLGGCLDLLVIEPALSVEEAARVEHDG